MLDPNTNKNPSSGLPVRNPTHAVEADNADDQSDIVKAIRDSGVKRMVVTYDYSNIDRQSPPPLSGILKIREMNQEQAISFCKNLMRSKPNIFRLTIKLGNYENQVRINSPKARALNSVKARFHTEIGEKIGDILSDKTLLVTEIKYRVENNEPGRFNATAEVFGVTDKEYFDDSKFSPVISFEFIKTN